MSTFFLIGGGGIPLSAAPQMFLFFLHFVLSPKQKLKVVAAAADTQRSVLFGLVVLPCEGGVLGGRWRCLAGG